MNNFYAFEGSEHVFGVRTEKNELEIKAIKKIEDKIEKTKQEYIQGKIDFYPPGAFVAGYDIDNKYVWADYSRTITLKKDLHKQLRDLIDKKIGEGKINEYGEYGKKTPRGQIGRCAEVHVVDKILKFNENFYKNNNKIDNIRLSFAVRFKDKNKILSCNYSAHSILYPFFS